MATFGSKLTLCSQGVCGRGSWAQVDEVRQDARRRCHGYGSGLYQQDTQLCSRGSVHALFCDMGGVVFGSIIMTLCEIVSWMIKTAAATLNCMGSSLYGSTGQSTGVHLIWWHVGIRGRQISSFIAKQRVHFVGLSCSVSEGVAVGIAPDMGSIIAASVK